MITIYSVSMKWIITVTAVWNDGRYIYAHILGYDNEKMIKDDCENEEAAQEVINLIANAIANGVKLINI